MHLRKLLGKATVAVGVLALGCTGLAFAGTYSFSDIASALERRDAKAGNPEASRSHEMVLMVERTGNQCKQKGDTGDTAGGVAMMVISVQNKLKSQGVTVTSYELLDVLYSLMGDGAKDWDCAGALSMYLAARTGNPVAAKTHISAYKMLQAFRDNGMLGK